MSSPVSSFISWLRELKESTIISWNRLSKKTQSRLIIAFFCAESLGLSLILRRFLLTRRGESAVVTPVVVSVGLSALINLIKQGSISKVDFFPDGKLIGLNPIRNELVHSMTVPGSEEALFSLVKDNCADFKYVHPSPNFVGIAAQVIVPLAFFGVWYKLMKSFMNQANPSSEDTVDRRQKIIPKISFQQVVSRGKIELEEIVEYLNNPKSFTRFGAKLPRGVLLVGASGTGKTLMARAVAGEAKCAFLSVSASEFVETYVGRGSARVRALFKQARELSPCVLFIDEIDALGKRQSTFGGGTAHDEYVQTMNQLLVELDGITGHEDGLVVIGATNRFQALDSALLRPGRFDRHVWLDLPCEKERFEILQLNCTTRNMAVKANDLHVVSRQAISFSGADLANLINESIFFSRRRKSEIVQLVDLMAALDKCMQIVSNRRSDTPNNISRPREDISTALE